MEKTTSSLSLTIALDYDLLKELQHVISKIRQI